MVWNSSLPITETTTKVGLGYGIAIAVGLLVLVSTIMLASYACVKVKGRSSRNTADSSFQATVPDFLTPENHFIMTGLDEQSISGFPRVVFRRAQDIPRPVNDGCPICLGEFRKGEVIRWVPDCLHCFHVSCIDGWLRLNGSCPVCRNSPIPSPIPTPIPTPLSELVPLAVHR
ncbi:hypothetical protein AMTRI_Chr01g127260 [Amborella trichopoda]|uniref:RING-type domain-containing protein n=1 Tax=Amborella trichopoda TaxID=13333 RepID=W1NQA5_AMBTC|nr:putative RING-H2 finger protein ATL69 [Amborella trichopoda]ERM99091.1 hypothetical protein AMTR_s00101p00120240 [Amborella trichopoda]|eukprot:XP_020518522.1 putative RING-H2 finger protein ATL69 [Amborella trichopoda]